MHKKNDNHDRLKADTGRIRSGVPKIQDAIEKKSVGQTHDPEPVDRPGFDLGGSTGDTTAGTGLGLGEDAGEIRWDRSLPGRPAGATLSIPRWSGPTPKVLPPSDKDKASELKNR
jgi:hypothetical protein